MPFKIRFIVHAQALGGAESEARRAWREASLRARFPRIADRRKGWGQPVEPYESEARRMWRARRVPPEWKPVFDRFDHMQRVLVSMAASFEQAGRGMQALAERLSAHEA